MSLFDRLRLSAHLDDAALAAICGDASLGGREPAHTHLETCGVCRARLAAFSAWLDALRTDATAEADAAFPRERLAAQHAQIFRRLEAAERPARVIAFPKFSQPLTSRSSNASRWIAAAAAAGLIVGVGMGQMMDFRHVVRVPAGTAADGPVRQIRPDPGVQSASNTGRDEAFLSELDASLSRAAVPELRALDELTPRAGDRSR